MINKATADHYTWGAGCDGWRLVSAPGLSVIHERMPPGTAEARHFHRAARQFFFVLSGAAVMEVDGVRETLGPQQGLEIAPGLPHRIFNESKFDLEFLVISHPATLGDRVLREDPTPLR
jgi:mannose-6-phosphate isomerase-like protein (cupin superfamily)